MILFASDYDGTLHFQSEKGSYFKEEDLLKIKELRLKGNLFSLCTGRIIDTIKQNLVDNIEFDYAIASTGAQIFDKNFNDFYHVNCDFASLRDIYINYSDRCKFYYHVGGYPYVVGKDSIHYGNCREFDSIDDLVNETICGVSVYTPDNETARNLCLELNNRYSLLSIFQNNNWLDIVNKSVSKGITALRLKEMVNASLLAGIGDSYNDIELLKASDISFTFHDSPIEVKQHATYLVDSVAEAIDIVINLEQSIL